MALHVHLVEAVHENVRDLRVREQLFQRAQAEQFVQDVTDERLAFEETERDLVALGVEHAHDHAADFGLRFLAAHTGEAFQVEAVQQPLVDPALEFLVLRMSCVDADGSLRHQSHRLSPSAVTNVLSAGRRCFCRPFAAEHRPTVPRVRMRGS